MSNVKKNKVTSLEIIVRMIGDKPYYELKYREVGKEYYSVGYSSCDLKIVLEYIDTYFEIVTDKRSNADRIRNMSDEELAELLHNISPYVESGCPIIDIYIGENVTKLDDSHRDILEWLQSEAE